MLSSIPATRADPQPVVAGKNVTCIGYITTGGPHEKRERQLLSVPISTILLVFGATHTIADGTAMTLENTACFVLERRGWQSMKGREKAKKRVMATTTTTSAHLVTTLLFLVIGSYRGHWWLTSQKTNTLSSLTNEGHKRCIVAAGISYATGHKSRESWSRSGHRDRRFRQHQTFPRTPRSWRRKRMTFLRLGTPRRGRRRGCSR